MPWWMWLILGILTGGLVVIFWIWWSFKDSFR
jgi:hypothetical protein